MRWAYNNYASYEFLVSTFYINIVDSHSVLYILYIFGRDVLSLSFVVGTSTQGMYKNETGDEAPRKQDTRQTLM